MKWLYSGKRVQEVKCLPCMWPTEAQFPVPHNCPGTPPPQSLDAYRIKSKLWALPSFISLTNQSIQSENSTSSYVSWTKTHQLYTGIAALLKPRGCRRHQKLPLKEKRKWTSDAVGYCKLGEACICVCLLGNLAKTPDSLEKANTSKSIFYSVYMIVHQYLCVLEWDT